jgi:pyruvate formate lyase activating enzyme
VNLLPYHNIASGKYKKLEMIYDSAEMEEPTADEIKVATEIFGKYGIEVEVGG